ncbi:MAG: Zn-dependent exopeptidase M28 [Gammaproteobacteria bacterium]|nr:Zn-dependent exopeptidase M28 [Gammaproteobacteria bacterium]
MSFNQSLTASIVFIGTLMSGNLQASPTYTWQSLMKLTTAFPDRVAGTDEEFQTANWLIKELAKSGYTVQEQPFKFNYPISKSKNEIRSSRNLQVTIPGKTNQTLIIGAHYDAVPSVNGSSGFVDNASGVSVLLTLAKNLKNKSHDFTIKLVFFGAEEVGLQGAKYYANHIKDLKNIAGMINLDTTIGGDILYIHSAHSKPYQCDHIKSSKYSNSPLLRDKLLSISDENQPLLQQRFEKHPATKDYPEGETGSWSDHAPFACLGVPVAYIEATNFTINGESGYDGYSQTVHKDFWNCFDSKNKTACQRDNEQKWGKIWHTEYDQASFLVEQKGEELQHQLTSQVDLLTKFILDTKVDLNSAKQK